MQQLPTPLNCLIIQYSLDDPDTIEHYLTIDPETTEKCLPMALRDMLNDYAVPAGLVPMTTPNADELADYLEELWWHADNKTKLTRVIRARSIYMLPYMLSHYNHSDLCESTLDDIYDDLLPDVLDGDDRTLQLLRLLVAPSGGLWQPFYITRTVLTDAFRGEMFPDYSGKHYVKLEDVLKTIEVLLSGKPDKTTVNAALLDAIDQWPVNMEIVALVSSYLAGDGLPD